MELNAIFTPLEEDKISSITENLKGLEKSEIKWRKFRVIASTEDSDRSWEIIKATWWDYTNFMKNPVIIANHVYKIENIVGKATNISVEHDKLVIEGVFSEVNPLWKLLADLYEEWMVKTVSVGFIPKEREGKTITSAELLELSFVAVPCNPNALSLDQKQLLEDNWMLEDNQLSQILEELNVIKSQLNVLISTKNEDSNLEDLSKSIKNWIKSFINNQL